MHIPKIFEQGNSEELQKMILMYPFATLVGYASNGINADHIPLYLERISNKKAVLKGHIGKANPLWQKVLTGSDALAIFHGPDSYISPNYYPSKKIDGKVVPTWNYVAVHVKGTIAFIHDQTWKMDMLNSLTDQHEKKEESPWSVSDAPNDFTDKLLNGIVGIELEIESMTGQWKVSQNKSEEDRQGVVKGLSKIDAVEMAKLVNEN